MLYRDWQRDILAREPRVLRDELPPRAVQLTPADMRFLRAVGASVALAPGR